MQSDIIWGSLFKFCVENSGILSVEPDIHKDGYSIFVKIPSKNILLKQYLPNSMDFLHSIKYIENEVVKGFQQKLDEMTDVQFKKG